MTGQLHNKTTISLKMSANWKKMDCGFDKETSRCCLGSWKHHNGILHEVENVFTGAKLRQLEKNVCDIYQQYYKLEQEWIVEMLPVCSIELDPSSSCFPLVLWGVCGWGLRLSSG
jgi:hypothetical protein